MKSSENWISDFLESYKTERRAPENTIASYRMDLHQFQSHSASANCSSELA